MLEDLKKFLLRGNVIDLAAAVIIGIAFGAVVTSLVDDVIMAFIGAVFGEPNFNDLTWSVGDGVVRYGSFLTSVVNFLIIGVALFVVIRAVQQLVSLRDPEEQEAAPAEIELLTQIRDELRRGP